MKTIFFFIRCRDRLDADHEQTITLYGEPKEFEFFLDLCRWLSVMSPKRLVEFGHYAYTTKGTVSEIRFGGKEISVDDKGAYFKFEGNNYYVLKDSIEGLVWERMDE